MITEMIYQGRDNENELIFDQSIAGAANFFEGVTRMVLTFRGSDAVVDSAINPELISWTADGHVSVRLGMLPITPSKYFGTLIAYDPVHDDGQVIFHSAEGSVQFWFIPA
jgi:hypothetical protein